MAERRMRRRKRRSRRRAAPGTSMVTYQQIVDLDSRPPTAGTTQLVTQELSQVANLEGETVNRKILRIAGDLAFATQPTAGHYVVAMFAMWAHPKLEDFPTVGAFDPFATGPAGAGTGTYEGRPSPRPFGRRMLVHTLQAGGAATQLFRDMRYSTKAERLLRPGWVLSAGLWVRSSQAGPVVKVSGLISVTVAG